MGREVIVTKPTYYRRVCAACMGPIVEEVPACPMCGSPPIATLVRISETEARRLIEAAEREGGSCER